MPATFTKGDLFNTKGLHAYALASNARGTMDAGVAVAFKKRWPNLAVALSARAAEGGLALGDVVAFSEGEETVYALILQEDATKKAKLASLTKAVNRLVELASQGGDRACRPLPSWNRKSRPRLAPREAHPRGDRQGDRRHPGGLRAVRAREGIRVKAAISGL